jgi:hypothetical protein
VTSTTASRRPLASHAPSSALADARAARLRDAIAASNKGPFLAIAEASLVLMDLTNEMAQAADPMPALRERAHKYPLDRNNPVLIAERTLATLCGSSAAFVELVPTRRRNVLAYARAILNMLSGNKAPALVDPAVWREVNAIAPVPRQLAA